MKWEGTASREAENIRKRTRKGKGKGEPVKHRTGEGKESP